MSSHASTPRDQTRRGSLSRSRRRLLAFSLGIAASGLASLVVAAAASAAYVAPLPTAPYIEHPQCLASGHTGLAFSAQIQPGLLKTEWSFAYSTSKGGPWTAVPGGSGTITQAEAEGLSSPLHQGQSQIAMEVRATGLVVSPEHPYYVLVKATNSEGSVSAEGSQDCEAQPLHPSPSISEAHNITTSSARLSGAIAPNENAVAVSWRFEYSPTANGSFQPVPGGEGMVSQAEAEATPSADFVSMAASLNGLSPGKRYYMRLVAESEPEFPAGSGTKLHEQAISPVGSFETSGSPTPVTFATHALDGEAVRALGSVNPQSVPTSAEQTITLTGAPTGGTFSLSFDGQSTGATGTGDIGAAGGSASGSGNLSAAEAGGEILGGSNVITHVNTRWGAFAVGQRFEFTGTKFPYSVPAGTTITAVGSGTLTLSAAVSKPFQPEVSEFEEFRAASDTVTNVVASAGSFAVGQHVTGAGVPPYTFVTGIGAGTLTLSKPASAAGSGVVLTAAPDVITNVRASSGVFTVGEAISGPGIPAGTTITGTQEEEGALLLELSGNATATGSGVALSSSLPYNASPETLNLALSALPDKSGLSVVGPLGGPYTVLFGEVSEPQIEGDGSGLTPPGTVAVATTQRGGVGDEAHYRFQYVSEEQFHADGWAAAELSAPVNAGFGDTAQIIGENLPGLKSGVSYRYRLLAENQAGKAEGSEQTLTVPAAAGESPSASCPNEALRTGASASLPDCRAYEQVTPVEKHGSQELFNYGTGLGDSALVGGDGEDVVVDAQFANWAGGADPGQSPYFFSRTPAGWQMTVASPQPQTGVTRPQTQVFSSDLTQFAFESGYETSSGAGLSANIEFKAGPPGGPYASVVVPRNEVGPIYKSGWVAASEDFSKLILGVEDHELLGESTGTKSGEDLYEDTNGELREVNVNSQGETIGKCGARIVDGHEGGDGEGGFLASSPHSVSANGSRVFFYATPTGPCAPYEGESISTAGANLYVRVNETETIDLGHYRFLAANSEGTRALLEKINGEAHEVLLYEVSSGEAHPLFTAKTAFAAMSVSEDFTAIYFTVQGESLTPEAPAPPEKQGGLSRADLYRYDIASRTLGFVVQPANVATIAVSADGRYAYFQAPAVGARPSEHGVEGVPGGGVYENGEGEQRSVQVYRYDSVEKVIECITCASPFDPEPKLPATIGGNITGGRTGTANGSPAPTVISANGNFAFFSAASALVPSDVDGEIPPVAGEKDGQLNEYGDIEELTSPSSDVYEWRRNGVDGCTRVQGCLALITDGRGGYLNLLLGSADEGRDVFFYTSSQLTPSDKDTAGDIYDARIDGGFAPAPAGPVECEGDACSTPQSAPNDATPSSFTFAGAGNALAPLPEKPSPKGKKPKRKNKLMKTAGHVRKSRGRHKAPTARGKVKRSARRSK